jgi:hypothetical protein
MSTARTHPDFQHWQPAYAAHGIATFPVRIDSEGKRPLVKHYMRMGIGASARLAQGRQFADAQSFGFAVGERSNITVLDIDSDNDNDAAEAFDRHGATPLVVRSGSGHFQGWYRWEGERRLVRPDKTKPVDILGNGFVVAPPSRGELRNYEIIQGSLDDLEQLPTLRRWGGATEPVNWREMHANSGRNNRLFRQLCVEVRACDDLDQLMDRARWLNGQFGEPLPDGEVVSVSKSVWRIEKEGRNRFGQRGVWFPSAIAQSLVADPYLLALVTWLKDQNKPNAKFLIADGLRHRFGDQWSRRDFEKARKRGVDQGWFVPTTQPRPGQAVLYVWGPKFHQAVQNNNQVSKQETTTLSVEDSLPILVGVGACHNSDRGRR